LLPDLLNFSANQVYYSGVLQSKNCAVTRINASGLNFLGVFTLQGSQVRNLHRPPKIPNEIKHLEETLGAFSYV
jgi:hypothetical protein